MKSVKTIKIKAKKPAKKALVAKKLPTKAFAKRPIAIKKKASAKKVIARSNNSQKIKKRVIKRVPKNKPVKYFASFSGLIAVIALVVAVYTGVQALSSITNDNVLSDSTTTTAPLAPTDLVASVKGSTVTLTWADTSSVAADKYAIYRYDDASGSYVAAPKNQVLSNFSRKYISNENDSGKTYLYKVAGIRVYYQSGQAGALEKSGEMSDVVSVKIPEISTPVSPSNLRAKVKNSLISLSWAGNADSYKIERYDSTLKKYILETDDSGISSKSFSNREYQPGKAYRFRVSALNNVRQSGVITDVLTSSKYAVITVKVPSAKAPTAPTGIKSSISNGVIRLTWNNPSRYIYSGSVVTDINGADGYEIMAYSYVSKEWSIINPKNVKFVSDRVVNILGQNSGESVQYKILAYKKIYSEASREITNLEGPYSKPISVTMP